MSRATEILTRVSEQGPPSPLGRGKFTVTVSNHDGSGVEVSHHNKHADAIDRAVSAVPDGKWQRHSLGNNKFGNARVGERRTAVITGY